MSLRCRTECRTCGGALDAFLDLGEQPLANRLPRPHEAAAIEKFPLTLCRCTRCGLAQLREVVSPDLLFADYLYVPSTSSTMREHFDGLARAAAARLDLAFDDLVVDIGSNDGLLLSCFQRRGVRILGVEPAANIARAATAAGIPTAEEFFDIDVAKGLAQQHGRAALVTATNVFAHVDDVRGFMRAAFELLAADGIFLVEVQSFADTVETLAFDMTYHEHVTYWAAEPLARFCEGEGLALLDVERVATHGGSLRAFIGRPGHRIARPDAVAARIARERDAVGAEGCARLARGAANVRDALPRLVREIRAGGGRVAGYGAPAKATVLLNYCALGGDDIDYVVDRNPLKQGRLVPGVDVPVVGLEQLESDPPTHLLLLAWNLVNEIMRAQSDFAARGGRFILPVPHPTIVP
jgi:hypothetical protein